MKGSTGKQTPLKPRMVITTPKNLPKSDTYYGEDAEVSAYETFTLGDGTKEECKFTITDVKYNQKTTKLVYDITP